jgi:hypothetical protein
MREKIMSKVFKVLNKDVSIRINRDNTPPERFEVAINNEIFTYGYLPDAVDKVREAAPELIALNLVDIIKEKIWLR